MSETPQVRAVADAADVARQHPGITRARLATRLGGRRTTALATIEQALREGVLCEGTARVAVRNGSRTVVGLYTPETAPAVDDNPGLVDPADYLRALRKQLGIPAHRIATALEVSESQVFHWEAGRQPVPAWAAARIPAAVEVATVPASDASRRRRSSRAAKAAAARRVMADHPGITVTDLAEEMGISRSDAAQRVRLLLERESAHGVRYGRPSREGRLGSRARGLYVGAPNPDDDTPTRADLADLAAAARAAGWSGRRVATALGISRASWYHAANGTRPLPDFVTAAEVNTARRAAQRDRTQLGERLVEHVSRGDVTYEQLTRGTFGRSTAVLDALRHLLEAGRLHYADAAVPGVGAAAGGERYVRVLRAGPAPTPTVGLTGAELERLRRSRGLTRPALAAAVGVSGTQVGHWENGRQRIPTGRAQQLRAYLETVATAVEPLVDHQRVDDAELRRRIVAHVDEHPGSTARAAAGRVAGGSMQRRLQAVRDLLADDVLVTYPVTGHRGDGVAFTAAGLFLADDVPAQ